MQPVGYSHRSLANKLGIKPGMRLCILNAPPDYFPLMGDVIQPVEVDARIDPMRTYDFMHAFLTDQVALLALFAGAKTCLTPHGMLWVSWPKQSAKMITNITEQPIREVGRASGLVDVKVVAIDLTWSGLKFVYRLKDR